MPEMYLQQISFTYMQNKERIQRFKETGDSRYIYQNKLDKACFQHDMSYRDFKNFLFRRAASDKALYDKAFNIAKNPKYDAYQWGIASMVYKSFNKKSEVVLLCKTSN